MLEYDYTAGRDLSIPCSYVETEIRIIAANSDDELDLIEEFEFEVRMAHPEMSEAEASDLASYYFEQSRVA